jgi:hypothetical protein
MITRAEFEAEVSLCLQEWYYDNPSAEGNGAHWDAVAFVDDLVIRFPDLLNFAPVTT